MKKILLVLLSLLSLTCFLTACNENKNDACAHSYGEWDIVDAATCLENGLKSHTCSKCGDIETQIIEALEHTEVIDERVEPSCDSTGLTEGKHCSSCGTVFINQETIDKLEHIEIVHEAKAPTCANVGWNEYITCQREGCEYSTYNEISATGIHTWNNGEITTQPTCTVKGVKTFICEVCHTATCTEDIKSLGHDEETHEAKASTCTNIGWEEYVTCKRAGCQYSTYSEIPATGIHTWNNGEITTQPTCTVKGVKTFTCKICIKATYIEEINALGHKEVIDERVEPTCTSTGLTEGKHCSRCSEILVTQQLTNKIDCIEGNLIIDKEATKIEDGNSHTECIMCGNIIKENTIPAIGSIGLVYEVNKDGTSCTITSIGTCEDSQIVIPKIIDGHIVTSIGENAFAECTAISSINIPTTITCIGTRAFYGCTELTEIIIPDSVKSMGTQIFYKTNKLHTVYYNSSYCDYIGYPDYKNNNPILNVSNISKIVFNGDYVPAYILKDATNIKEIVLGENVQHIYDYAFYGCTSLTSVDIPDTVTSIGNYAFYDCGSLASIDIPDTVTNIGREAFRRCKLLTSITIPNFVTSISSATFYGCTSLVSVKLGNSVTSIGSSAFSNCTSLKNITICDSVKNIADFAFDDCISLNDVYYIGELSNWLQITFSRYGNANPLENGANLYFNNVLITQIEIPDSVTSISERAFTGCSSLTSVIIPDSVISVGGGAFSGCTSLTSVMLPNSVTNINEGVFGGCTSLTNITIPDSVESIGDRAFYGCSSLASIAFSDSLTSIGQDAFSACTLLTSVIIPDKVTSIGSSAFYYCTTLKIYCESDKQPSGWNNHWNWLGTTNYIPVVWGCSEYNNAFYQKNDGNAYHTLVGIKDKSITIVELHAETKVIGENAFYNCTSLTSITIPDFVTNIGKQAFYKCTSLASITIPSSVTSIGYSAFYGCTSLTSVTIPNSVTTIASYAFENCPLRIITFEGTVEQWKVIGKYYGWNNYTKTYIIYCTDGMISKDGTVTYNK